jgi:tripartite-type tricarboxylate transporter receptor subunit TctC
MPRSAWALAFFLLLAPVAAKAQDWPGKEPIKIIVPFSAGSATDIIARTVFNQVGSQIGQTFVVENRGGAGTCETTRIITPPVPPQQRTYRPA